MPHPIFDSLPFSSNKTVSWIHIGDLHMTRVGEQNETDLGRIVDEINAVYANGGVDFVYIPGDIADDGSAVAYEAVRRHLDRLKIPWCGIVGDHDVHEKSFHNFQHYIAKDLYGSFSLGPYRFLRLNAFSIPRPDSFTLDDDQLRWLEKELKHCSNAGQRAVLFLHCYPSELKHGAGGLKKLLQQYPVLLVDMGHTHYNEVSNDGCLLYSATRSTGQIEEGPVGYSLTTIDEDVASWHFIELGSPALASITYPSDERLVTQRSGEAVPGGEVPVRVKAWSGSRISGVAVEVEGTRTTLTSGDGVLWSGSLALGGTDDGTHSLQVTATDEGGEQTSSIIRLRIGSMPDRYVAERDVDNAIGAWTDRGLLGTQLGPNKNGKKW